MNNKINIYVSYHKEYTRVLSPCYIPIQVGAEIAKDKLNMLGDNEGENISERQPRYSDVTSHYYAYKNDKDGDYIGFVHYRRMFVFNSRKLSASKVISLDKNGVTQGFDYNSINSALRAYDIIVPREVKYGASNYEVLCKSYTKELIDLYIGTIKDIYPKYFNSVNKYMNDKKGVCYNIFIMKRDLFMEYASFKFDVLFELEKRMEERAMKDPFGRLFGYLSEFFINIFISYKNESGRLKVRTLQSVMIDGPINGQSSYRMNYFH